MIRICNVRNETKGTCIGTRIELASSQKTRMLGLLGRSGLEQEEGLWIRPSNGVHTFGMSFPIDVIGLDRHNRILRLWHCLPPQRITALYWKMQSVLELPAGTIHKTGTAIGDAISIAVGEG